MPRVVSVAELVKESGLDFTLVLVLLQEGGFSVKSSLDTIPRGRMSEAFRLLEIRKRPKTNSLARLSEDFGIPADEVKSALRKAGLLSKPSQSRIPYPQLGKAVALLRKRRHKLGTASPPPIPPAYAPYAPPGLPERQEALHRSSSPAWYTVGKVEDYLIFLTANDAEKIHWTLVQDYRDSRDPLSPAGVKSHQLLESAVFRPMTGIGTQRKYPTVSMGGAALLHSLVHNHPFHNGNKRTALVSLIVFLHNNGYILTASKEDLFEFVLSLSGHVLPGSESATGNALAELEVLLAAHWIQARIRKAKRGEEALKFRGLRSILSRYGCTFEILPGNRVVIRRKGLQSHVARSSEGMEVPKNMVHKIRRDLELDDEHGCDQEVFYNALEKIPDFINKYRWTLDRLAKL